jgi:hypothetical protein
MVNGGAPDTVAEQIRQSALSITNPATPGILKRLGARYVLAIPSLYREGYHLNYIEPSMFDPSKVPSTLRKVKQFADCTVYENLAGPAEIIPLFVSGAYQPTVTPDGAAWHPGAGEMVVNIKSDREETVVADVSFEAAATSKRGTIEFQLNGASGGPQALPVKSARYTIKSVAIRPGSNYLTISSSSAAVPVTEVPGATTVNVGIMVSDIQLTPQNAR